MFSRQNFISIIAISCFYNSALVRSGPVTKGIITATCSFPSFECDDNNGNARCIPASQICDGVSQCQNSEDEITCENDGSQFVISTQLQSSAVEMPTIPEITMKGCAKVCREYRDFDCIAIQHNLQSNECRLLDAKFTKKSNKPSLRGFWATFELQNSSVPNKNTTADIPNPVFDDPNRGAEIRETDDAVILEIDLDAFAGRERKKRQSGFSFPDVLGALANIFFRSPFTSQPQGRTLGSSFSSCGVRTVEFDPPRRRGAGRIINGVTPPYGAFPWQAALKKTDRSGSFVHHCGGAIVSDRHILTAAHCLIGFRRDDFQVVVGEYDVKHEDSFENVFEVEEFIIHHNYHQRHKRSDDIALVKIEMKDDRGFQFNSKIQPICLPSSEAVYEPGRWCTASGWGIQKAGDRSSVAKVLKAISVPILSKEECTRKEVYGSNSATEAITEGMICAGYLEGGIDACGGDSGGPLACNIDGQFQLLGLVSWGDGCARENKPGVYVKVYHYINWIHEWMRKL